MIFSGRRSRLGGRRNCAINRSRDIFRKSRKVGLALILTSRPPLESLQLGRVPLAKCPQFSLRTQNRVRNHVPLHRHGQNFRSPRLSPRPLFYRGASPRAAEKKSSFLGGKGRFCDFDIFSKKKTDGNIFMWGSNEISGLHLRVRAAVGEIMLNKVPWALGEVSL